MLDVVKAVLLDGIKDLCKQLITYRVYEFCIGLSSKHKGGKWSYVFVILIHIFRFLILTSLDKQITSMQL